MDNQQAKQHYRNYNPSCIITPIKERFFSELTNYKFIFEFGCNNGLNLTTIKNLYPESEVYGIDVNQQSLDPLIPFTHQGDEEFLKTIPDNCEDLIFTSSVLCHIPNIDEIIIQFKRIASTVVLLETNEIKGEYYFSHDYEKFGFVKEYSMYSPNNPIGNGALYDKWIWKK